jgi:hypothetical protein
MSKDIPKSGKTFHRKAERFFTPALDLVPSEERSLGYHLTIGAGRFLARHSQHAEKKP